MAPGPCILYSTKPHVLGAGFPLVRAAEWFFLCAHHLFLSKGAGWQQNLNRIKLSQAAHFLTLNPSKFLFCTSFTKLLCLHILVRISTPALQASGEVWGARRVTKGNWCCFLLRRQHISAGHHGAPRCKDSGRFRLIFKGKKKSLSEKWRRDNNTCGCTSEDNGKNNQISCSWEETNCTRGSGRHFHPLLSFAQLAAALLLWKREVEGGKGSLLVLFVAFFAEEMEGKARVALVCP